MTTDAVLDILAEAKKLAQRYRALTGMPLGQRHKAVEELRNNRVGVLIHIFDELDGMGLSASEIERILSRCGLNRDAALSMGMSMRDSKGPRR